MMIVDDDDDDGDDGNDDEMANAFTATFAQIGKVATWCPKLMRRNDDGDDDDAKLV